MDPAFANALTDLLTVIGPARPADAGAGQERLAGWLTQHPDDRDVLVAGLTRSLADPAYLRQHLRHLRRLSARMLPYEALMPDDRVDRLLRYGPARLRDGELAWLALCPEQLHALRDEIGENLTPFWVEAVEAAMTQAARELGQTRLSTDELAAQIRERIGEGAGRGRRAGRRKRPVPLGEAAPAATPKEPQAERPVLYQGAWQPLTGPESAAHEVTAVLSPRPDGFELRFLNAPVAGGAGVLELRLVTAASVGDWVRISQGGFRFIVPGVPPPELLLDGRTLAAPAEAPPSAEPSFRVTLKADPTHPSR